MKKIFAIAILICLIGCNLFAETKTEKFWELWNDKRTEEAAAFLEDWKKEDKKDAELYVCYFNMYLNQAAKEQMHLEPFLPENFNGQYMEAHNENGDKIYLYSVMEYDAELCKKAADSIDTGLKYNPKRLDMHFGKAHLFYLIEDYSKQCDVIKNALKLNKKYKGSWLWTGNKTAESLGVGFAETIHEYIVEWYNTGNEVVFPIMKEISLLYVEQYPDDIIAYNDVGISAMLMDDYKTAKEYLARGYELEPSDMYILGNLARVCYNLGEVDTAKEYYEIMAASEDEDSAEYAKNLLLQLF